MGGEISRAVKELRTSYGIPVISLKMAGSVNEVSDLVVTDPTAAGVMAVMLVSHIGQFNLLDIHGKEY
jgi:energy-converting hydrogenase B subunit Q